MSDVQPWPAKMTREQQRSVNQRGKGFDAALKGKVGAAGWRFARGEVFRQAGDWFINVMPALLWQQGVMVRMTVKPMSLDPLFWDIVGLSKNRALPLSFRATGAWVLRPPSTDDYLGLTTIQVEQLAAKVLEWSDRQSAAIVRSISFESMLAALPEEQHLHGQPRALAICLHIMMNDLDGAGRLCNVDDPSARPLMREEGGFATHNEDGSISTFLDQARDWIVRRQ